MPKYVYQYIWSVSGRRQVMLCVLTGIVVALTAAPLELQRRITDDAFGPKNLNLLIVYCAIYLLLLVVQGTTKYFLNLSRGRTVEIVSRLLRLQIFTHLSELMAKEKDEAPAPDQCEVEGAAARSRRGVHQAAGEDRQDVAEEGPRDAAAGARRAARSPCATPDSG